MKLAVDGAGELIVGVTSGFGQTAPPQILVYAPGANGAATPVRRIAGDKTGLGTGASGADTLAVAVRPGGMRVRAAISSGTPPRVNVYANTANGNVPPDFTLSGPATGLRDTSALAVDDAAREYVMSAAGDTITVYLPDARGNTAPLRTISGPHTGLSDPLGLVIGPR